MLEFKSLYVTCSDKSRSAVSIVFISVRSNSNVVSRLREWDFGSDLKFSGSRPRLTLYKKELEALPKMLLRKALE